MTTEHTKNRQQIADQLQTALGAFGLFTIGWVVLERVATVADPFGLLSLLAGASLLSAIVALLALVAVASSLLRH